MGEPIPIVADTPALAPGMGFGHHASALADAIRGGHPPQFTVGIYGPWGSGKSSLLNAILRNLDNRGADGQVVPVLFDAWRFERSEYVVVPLLHTVYSRLRQIGDEPLAEYIGRVLSYLVSSLKFKLGGIEFQLDPAKLRRSKKTDLVELDYAFAKPFDELRKIPTVLKGRRIVVLVDDLDRCSPEKVVSLLESINLVMDVAGFIFVLALDYDVLIQAVATKYPHVSGHDFVQKMVQVPFWVPRLTLDEDGFLDELIPGWQQRCKSHLPEDFSDYAHDIASLAFDANPRQIKRLINASLVLHRIAKRADGEQLAAILGLQLRWPDRYRELYQETFATDEDGQPYQCLIRESEDQIALQRYYERFFAGENRSKQELKELLLLTESVAAPDAARSSTSQRKVGRNQPCPCGSGKKYKFCHGYTIGSRVSGEGAPDRNRPVSITENVQSTLDLLKTFSRENQEP